MFYSGEEGFEALAITPVETREDLKNIKADEEQRMKKRKEKQERSARKLPGTKRIQKRNIGIDFKKEYTLEEGFKLLKERSNAKFTESIDVAIHCNIDTKKGDQTIRTMVPLPKGTGKVIRIAVFAQGDHAKAAKEAGADHVGGLEFIDEVLQGRLDFDLCIATPEMMAHMGKLGRVLGPKSLMPNPKLGTVTNDVAKAIHSAKMGQVTLRADKQGIVHGSFGKITFSIDDLEENFSTLYKGLLAVKPENIKGEFITRIHISTTMGFGLKINLGSLKI